MYLLPKCADKLKYSVFWESMDELSLKKFLDFRLKANDLKDRDIEHRQYNRKSLKITMWCSTLLSTTVLVATGCGKGCDFSNDKLSDQINHFWDLQLKRQNILAEFKLHERRNRTNWRTRCVSNRPNTFWMQRERP
ncbi:10525_t:CDS:2 [Rhizophagus irregularis]|nr:10525_t:CDS:2 [Rhizophagus irregularis]